ncbi:MAG: DUF6292 family protein [Pseudonocardiaceae bacterium]
MDLPLTLGARGDVMRLVQDQQVERDVAELHWHEHTGWQFALRRRGEPDATPWRFLHLELAPVPAHVAAFTRGLLDGQDLGLPYPAQFRTPGHDPGALVALLSRRAVSTDRGPGRCQDVRP